MSSAINNFEVHEVFLGFVPLPRTDAATISDLLLDHLVKWSVDLERLRGMGFDGASNMSGVNSGVQARITARFPKAREKMAAPSDTDDLLADCPTEEREEEMLMNAINRECLPTLSDTR